MPPSAEYTEVRSSDGVRLCVRTAGRSDGAPIVFVHGFLQSHLSWVRQFAGPLAAEFHLVALDLRGHGWSDKPRELEAYRDPQRWADDVVALFDALRLHRPVLVGWSYGGHVICDYLAAHGHAGLSGVNFVAGAISNQDEHFGADIRLVGKTANANPSKSIATTREFLAACFAERPEQDDFETMLAYNAMVPPDVRSKLLGRSIDARAPLRALDIPVLFSHGTLDRIFTPAMSRFGSELVSNSKVSLYEGSGHSPFYEAAERFDDELAQFVRACRS